MRLAITAVLILVLATVQGQDVPASGNPPSDHGQEQRLEESARAIGGRLKEAYGEVHRMIGLLDQRVRKKGNTVEQDRALSLREELLEVKQELERVLDEVNATGPAPEVISNAHETLEMADALLKRVKASKISAVN